MKKYFFGGIHPADCKEMTSHKELVSFLQPDYVTIPLSQHIGVTAKPLVKKGEYVYKGQKIGDGEGLCVPVHASVSGTVVEVEPRPHTNGMDVLAVQIRNDKKDKMDPNLVPCVRPYELMAEELFDLIREAGITGMGGAAFPTERKAVTAMRRADTLIINGCECEPYITADDVVMKKYPEKVIEGIKLLARILEAKRVVWAVEDNKKEAISVIKRALKKADAKTENRKDELTAPEIFIELMVLPARYPQGGEKQLVQAVTGREIPADRLPVDAGCVVFNVTTVYSIYQAVWEGRPLIERIVTISGNGIVNPGNYLVPIGISFGNLIQAAGGLKEGTNRVVAGGPMMGKAQSDLDVPVVKNVGAVLCLLEEGRIGVSEKGICIRCGKCVQVCPMKLQPLYLYRYGKAGKKKQLLEYHLADCIECGCCSYICPAKLPLTERFRIDKKTAKEGSK